MTGKDIITQVHTQKTDLVDPIVWKQMQGMADKFIKSGAMPQHIKNAEQAIVVMQAGYEMGMKPMEAINSIYIVNGHTTVWGKAIVSQFRKHGYRLEFNEGDNSVTVIVTGQDGWKGTETFSFEEAEKSGYTKDKYGKLKFGWVEGANRNIKLRYNALNKLAKTQCAEVLGSAVGITEVYQDVVTEVIEGDQVEVMQDEDINAINNCKDLKELTTLFNKMQTKYKVRTIKDRFTKQKEIIEELKNDNS